MLDHELSTLIRDWAGAEAADGPSPSLRQRIIAIPDVVASRRGAASFGNRRTLLLLAAVLAMTVALGGALAVGAGLIHLPWQESDPIHPGAIDPCSVVAGGPSTQQTRNLLDGSVFDMEEEANSSPPRINSFDGGGCLYLATDDVSSLALFQLRNQITPTDRAEEVAARLFRAGAPPFSTGPMRLSVEGHPAWVGRLAVVWAGRATDSPYRVGLAVSADPYFFIVVPEVQTALDLTDRAGLSWWANHLEPQARALAGELLARLRSK